MKTNGLEITSEIKIRKLEIIFDDDVDVSDVDKYTQNAAHKIRESVNRQYACVVSNLPRAYRVIGSVGKLAYEVTLE